jgi:hypothetical protein
MTETADCPDTRDVLGTDLETYIILPFQIAHKNENRGFDAEIFRDSLKDSDWKCAANIHEPDSIAREGLDEAALKRIRYQAYNYFHPFVRSFWYDKNLVQRFRHRKLEMLKAEFHDPQQNKVWTATFDAVADLYHFLPDIGVLVLHLKAQERLPLRRAQECLDRLRRMYPPYIGGGGSYGGHFPDSVELFDADDKPFGQFAKEHIAGLISQAEDCETKQSCADETDRRARAHGHILAGHWAALLKPLGEKGGYQVQQLGDDRAALASKLNLYPASNTPLIQSVDRGNMVRLCFADAPGRDRLPYAQPYLERFEERFCYDRFWYQDGESRESPSRIMNCGYAFTYLGSGDDGYFTNEFDGAPVAFRHIYVPMAIIAHFQKAALLVASRRLADLSPYGKNGKPQKLDSTEFKEMEANFIAFTQTYWFNEITPQEQGIELFDMWRRELRLPELYQEHRQELQDIVAFINGREEARQTRAANALNQYAAYFAVAGLVVAYVSMLTGVLGMNVFEIDWLVGVDGLMKGLSLAAFVVLLVCLIPVVLAPFAMYFMPEKAKRYLTEMINHIHQKIRKTE